MKQKVFEKVLLSLYPDSKMRVLEFQVFERFEMKDGSDFNQKLAPFISVGIHTDEIIESTSLSSDNITEISNTISKFTQYEIEIYKI